MIVMVFEFEVAADELENYLEESTALREHLAGIDGFISVERFQSDARPGRFVAIGYFRADKAVSHWRNLPARRRAQALGRSKFFTQYRLVMADVKRDYTHQLRRATAPRDSNAAHHVRES